MSETEVVSETVVQDPVDAGQESQTTNETSESPAVENKAVDAPVGEAIKKEVERRIAREKEKIAQEARDSYIRDQGFTWNGKAITTEKEYREALKEQELYEQYRQQSYPDEVIPELVEARKMKEEQQNRSQVQMDYQTFLEAYPNIEGKDIPDEVWKQVEQGTKLIDAYMRYENKELKRKLNELSEKESKEQKNLENRRLSTGSVTGNSDGNSSSYYTPEQVERMSQSEISRNWKEIMDSQKRWYKR